MQGAVYLGLGALCGGRACGVLHPLCAAAPAAAATAAPLSGRGNHSGSRESRAHRGELQRSTAHLLRSCIHRCCHGCRLLPGPGAKHPGRLGWCGHTARGQDGCRRQPAVLRRMGTDPPQNGTDQFRLAISSPTAVSLHSLRLVHAAGANERCPHHSGWCRPAGIARLTAKASALHANHEKSSTWAARSMGGPCAPPHDVMEEMLARGACCVLSHCP